MTYKVCTIERWYIFLYLFLYLAVIFKCGDEDVY